MVRTTCSYVLDNFESALLKTIGKMSVELDRMRKRKGELEVELDNLARAVAQGDFSPALRAPQVDREREIGEMTAKLLESQPGYLRVKLQGIRSTIACYMRDIHAIFNSDADQTRALFAKHIEKITLTPTGDYYAASGTWSFMGRARIDGAGGRNWTERLPVRFVWLAAA